MIFDYETLKLIWWILVGTLLIGFAITDGMDMGVGVLLPFLGKTDEERRVIINTVGPHWDGNQVWLVTAGGAIFAAWPSVYAAAFSGFYMAMLLVLFVLFFRPVGFDYRSKIESTKWRNSWDWGLFAGGLVPALIFGVAFGNLLQGVPFHLDELLKPHYQGHFIFALLPLLNPFALLAGIISLAMLTLHGAIWLQMRTEGDIAARAKKATLYLGAVVVMLFSVCGLWIAFGGINFYHIVSQPDLGGLPNPLAKVVERDPHGLLANYGRYPIAMALPILGFVGIISAMLLSKAGKAGFAYVASAFGMASIIGTAGVSMFPFIMPSSTVPNSSLTVWDSTSSHLTLTVMFWAVVIFLPIVLGYTIWCYSRMWGKVTVEEIKARSHSAY